MGHGFLRSLHCVSHIELNQITACEKHAAGPGLCWLVGRLNPFNHPRLQHISLPPSSSSASAVLMSTTNQTAGPSRSNQNFAAIFQSALSEYETVTGKPLRDHPFATQFDRCDSPEDVLNVLRTQAQALSESRKCDERLMAWLDPTVHILFTFSGTLGEGIGLVSCFICPV